MEKFISYIKKNYIEVALISTITIVALILRLIVLKNYGDLWLDELYSWYFASQKTAFGTLFELIKQDLHMPLYFLILHFWMKIFGKSDVSMHLCTLFLTLPLIPISFYLMKNLFNKTTGYFSAIMFTINTFCIYYSVEVRFYGLVFLLSLISAFYFVKMLENLDKKYVIGFILSHALLLYTFPITPLLTFFYGVVGGVYILLNKKEHLKEYCHKFLILIVIAVPSLIVTTYNIIVMKFYALCSFTKDIYFFNWNIISDILENFFTSENFQLVTGQVNVYRSIIDNINQVDYYFLFVFVPILIGVSGFLKSLLTKNNKLYLFLLPSLLFLIFSLLLASFGAMSMLTRYTSIIYPIIICSVCYGLSAIRIKPMLVLIFLIFVVVNLTYFLFVKNNVYTHSRVEIANLTDVMNKIIMPKDDDLILIPYSGSKLMKYVPHGTFIPFIADDALLLKDKFSRDFYFDKKFFKMVKRDNVKELLSSDIYENKPFIFYNIRLSDYYFEKMKKGQKFIIVSYRNSFTMPLIQNWQMLANVEYYKNINLFVFLMSKITRDSIQLADIYLKPVMFYNDEQRDYSIYVYEKP